MAGSKGLSLKDVMFNEGKVRYLAGLFQSAHADFGEEQFVETVMATMLTLELKARSRLIGEVLAQHLPDDFAAAAKIVQAALPPMLDPDKTDDDFGEFILDPLGEFVVLKALDAPEIALPLLREITKRFTMEFALRFFLIAEPVQTMAALTGWVKDDNYHVRRLVSEGTRPNLPWGRKVPLEVVEPLAFLDVLHGDKTRFVTRSVANHLNDIAKIDPVLVVETLKRWQDLGVQDSKELDWMTRHALRTLVKKGNVDALAMLGYREAPVVEVSELSISAKEMSIGEEIRFAFSIKAKADENLMVDYVIDFVKASGKTAPKVFKIKKLAMKAGQVVELSKVHKFLKDASTFKHYAGRHTLYLQINGKRTEVGVFDLV